jgi:tetratricopeptide (TPR) repeat protein
VLAAGVLLLWFLAEPDACQPAFEQAKQQFTERHFELAAASFTRAIDVCPASERVPLLLALARSQLVAQQAREALATVGQVLKTDPRNTAALKVQSDAQYLLGRDDDAAQSLIAARQLDARNPEFPYALGRIYYQQHRYVDAVPQFQAALDIDPKSYKSYDNLGLCYEALGEDEHAILSYRKALDLVYKDHPEYDWVYANYSELLMKMGRYEEAFQFAAEASARNPRSARDCYLTGKALTKLGKWRLSARWLKRAIELDSHYAEPHYLLAQAYRKQGAEADALRELDRFKILAASQPRERR